MIVELGHFALILAFAVAIFQMVVPLVGAWAGNRGWMATADPAASAQFVLTAFSFAALTYAFVTSDFSLSLVVANSHTDKPLLYKITGVWGNHEGSLLLWVLILTLFGACASWFGKGLPPTLRARVLAVQSAVAVAFFAFILFTSNPFLRLASPHLMGKTSTRFCKTLLGVPPAVPLSRLCGTFDGLLLRRRGVDRGSR